MSFLINLLIVSCCVCIVRKQMELSEEFILELTEVQSRLFGFLFKRLADREQARGSCSEPTWFCAARQMTMSLIINAVCRIEFRFMHY